jgi:membrane protease YdiL (CAAX protease family)
MGEISKEEPASAAAAPHARLPGRGRTSAALAFAMLYPSLMAWIYFVVLAPPAATSQPSYAVLLAYGAGKLVQFGFPLLWVWVFEPERLQLRRPSFRGLEWGVGFGLAVGALILAAYYLGLRNGRLLSETPDRVRAKVAQFHMNTPALYLLMALLVAGVHSLMEEYYWRWFVFGELERRWPLLPAMLVSGLAFMLHHVIILSVYLPGRWLAAALPFSLAVAAGGAVWAWLYHRTGTIYSCWISHLLVDAAIMVVGYDLVFARGV